MTEKLKNNIYVIFGDDRFRLRLELIRLTCKLSTSDKILIKCSPKDDLQSTIFGLSLFAEKRLFFLNLADFENEHLMKLLETEKIPDTIEIICYQYGKLDKRLKFFKLLEKNAQEITEISEFSPWKTQEIIKWSSERAQELNIKIENLALQKLIEYYASDTASIDSELQKLYCYAEGKMIKLEHIELLCQAQNNLFDLIDLLLLKRFSEFSKTIKYLAVYQNPLQIIAGLQTIFRNYLTLKSLQLENLPSAEIARLINKNPWKVGQDLQKLKTIKFDFLLKLNEALNALEEDIKTGACFEPSLHMRFKILSLYSFV